MTGAESVALPDSTGRGLALGFGSLVALATSGVTVATFALAYMAGADDSPYPFSSDAIAGNWPREYLWMFPAMLLMLLFVAFVASVHEYAPATRKIFSLLGLCFAIMAAAILLTTYFIQVTVMQPSLEKGQLDGWAMLTMYNPNGVFIASEELGYILMSLALAVLAPVFLQKNKVEQTIRWLFVLSCATVVGALIAVSVATGFDRGVLFEIIAISIVWLTLIVSGPLVAVVFRRSAARSTRTDLPTEERG
ncbi:MAG: hypothetical protein WCF36_06095 [Candidatus Nanopelagicales bacterium]